MEEEAVHQRLKSPRRKRIPRKKGVKQSGMVQLITNVSDVKGNQSKFSSLDSNISLGTHDGFCV